MKTPPIGRRAQRQAARRQCRILPNDDPDEFDRELRKVIASHKVNVTYKSKPLKSPPSPLREDVMGVVEKLTWPGVPVIPSMSTGATDSRFLRLLTLAGETKAGYGEPLAGMNISLG